MKQQKWTKIASVALVLMAASLTACVEDGELANNPKSAAARNAKAAGAVVKRSIVNAHDHQFAVDCLVAGTTEQIQQCHELMQNKETPYTIYLRVMNAQEGNTPINGIGIWDSRRAFEGCGSIDLLQSEVDRLASQTPAVSLYPNSVAIGEAFASDLVSCPLRDPNAPAVDRNLSNYYRVGRLDVVPGGWVSRQEEAQYSNGCDYRFQSEITFYYTQGGELLARYFSRETHQGQCYTSGEKILDFVMRLVQ